MKTETAPWVCSTEFGALKGDYSILQTLTSSPRLRTVSFDPVTLMDHGANNATGHTVAETETVYGKTTSFFWLLHQKNPHRHRSINLSKRRCAVKTYLGIDCADVAGGAEGHENRVLKKKKEKELEEERGKGQNLNMASSKQTVSVYFNLLS